jgi:hypothetical protein
MYPAIRNSQLGGFQNRNFMCSAQPRPQPISREERCLVRSQDQEYQDACAAYTREMEEQRRLEEQKILEEQNELERIAEQTALLQAKCLSLPPEPAQGTTIAINLDGKRKMRKFGADEPGEHVYYWVASEFISAGQTKEIEEFEVRFIDKVIDKEATLEEQNITGRVVLSVCEL